MINGQLIVGKRMTQKKKVTRTLDETGVVADVQNQLGIRHRSDIKFIDIDTIDSILVTSGIVVSGIS